MVRWSVNVLFLSVIIPDIFTKFPRMSDEWISSSVVEGTFFFTKFTREHNLGTVKSIGLYFILNVHLIAMIFHGTRVGISFRPDRSSFWEFLGNQIILGFNFFFSNFIFIQVVFQIAIQGNDYESFRVNLSPPE